MTSRNIQTDGDMQRTLTRIEGWLVVALLAATASTGCIQEEPEFDVESGTSDIQPNQERVGAIHTEFRKITTHGDTTSNSDHRVRLHAQFLDVRGLKAETALSALDVWQYPSSLDRDTCSLSASAEPTVGSNGDIAESAGPRFRMQLLDVGPLQVRTSGQRVTLEPRRIPDLSRAFSGVVYGIDQTLQTTRTGTQTAKRSLKYRPGATYQFSAPGGPATAGFEVAVKAPRPVDIVDIRRQSTSEQWRHLGSDAAVHIRWKTRSAVDAGPESGEIFMDVAASSGGDHLTCRLADDGRFTLPAELVDQIGDGEADLTFVLRRVQSRKIQVPGLDDTRLTISATDLRRMSAVDAASTVE